MKDKYQKTIYACFIGYVVQAVVNNFVPLLFLTFEKTYGIPLSKITMLITLNFGVQLIVDLLSAGFVDKIGYRVSIVIAHAASALGLIGLVVLPNLLPEYGRGRKPISRRLEQGSQCLWILFPRWKNRWENII